MTAVDVVRDEVRKAKTDRGIYASVEDLPPAILTVLADHPEALETWRRAHNRAVDPDQGEGQEENDPVEAAWQEVGRRHGLGPHAAGRTTKALLLTAAVAVRKDAPTVTDVHVNRTLATEAPRAKGECPACGEPMGRKRICPNCGYSLTADVPTVQNGKTEFVPLAKAKAEQRFTFAPLYVANTLDAHGEWASPDDLQKAVWDYARSGNREITLQHMGVPIGEWVELACWPWQHEADLMIPGEGVRKVKLPEGTPWMGVVWSEQAWPLIKAGRLRGLSIEGRSQRVEADIPLAA